MVCETEAHIGIGIDGAIVIIAGSPLPGIPKLGSGDTSLSWQKSAHLKAPRSRPSSFTCPPS